MTRFALALVTALATVGAVAGCGGSSSSTSSGSTASLTATPDVNVPLDKKVAAELPSAVKSKGTLSVAADATYAPNEFIASDGHTVIGMDADLAKALAQAMGLQVEVKNVTFDSIIPGLAANKYDLGMSSFTVTKEREKTVDFVSYANAGTSFFVKAEGGPSVQSLANLCGQKVAAERGTTQEADATAQDKKCKAAGKPGVSVNVFPDENGVNLALASGRATVGMADSPPAAYAVEQSNGQLKLSGTQYGVAAYGIAMPKSTGLAKPVLDALKDVMADGTYKRIFDYWGLSGTSASNGCPCTLDNPQINPTNVPAS
ncbi:MAG TPA: ABC transporter substrate-binding protein [Solirubrobacterales bacterium]|nr:ABC transporter substrate-binding protein [Solirubrobacterales bacterium]